MELLSTSDIGPAQKAVTASSKFLNFTQQRYRVEGIDLGTNEITGRPASREIPGTLQSDEQAGRLQRSFSQRPPLSVPYTHIPTIDGYSAE